MKPKHTPGPWFVDGDVMDACYIAADHEQGDMPIASMLVDAKEYLANARLIASAPELLEALDNLVCKLTDMNSKGQIMDDDDVNTLIRDAFDLSERIKATDGAE